MSARRRRMLCGVLFVGLPPLVLAGAWRLAGVSALEDDLIYYFPIRAFIGEQLAAGHWPLWNQYVAMGTSLAADPQSGLWYPPTWLFAILPAVLAYPIQICLHFSLAGVGMYRFGRSCGYEWRAALVGGLAYMFCGFLVGHRAHLTILQTAAWLPWMLYGWQRFAAGARREGFGIGAGALGAAMLIQHIQIVLIALFIVSAYVLFVLIRRSWRLLVWYPIGVVAGVLIGGVQLVPTLAAFAGSTRQAANYNVFVENSYAPTSLFMWLFPMLFGARTPNFYLQPWWGWSHWCEQATYASIAVLVMAVAALALWRRDRLVRFWMSLGGACFVVALGKFTPLSRVLFEVPFLNSLRVPARWMIGVDVAMVMLAVAGLDALLRRDPAMCRWTRRVVTIGLPIAVGAVIVCMVIARIRVQDWLEAQGWVPVGAISSALRPLNPAIWVPLLLMIATGVVLLGMAAQRQRVFRWLVLVIVLDLASVAAFVDVDVSTYTRSDITSTPDWAFRILLRSDGDIGDRFWVPRQSADYERPLEVLWPQTNVMHRMQALHGYGPIWPQRYRMLTRMMPWGASEDALTLLFQPDLLRALGVRWLVARTDAEKRLIALGNAGYRIGEASRLTSKDEAIAIDGPKGRDWSVSIPRAGVYLVAFRVEPPASLSRNRWYLWIEDEQGERLGLLRMFDPVDTNVSREYRCFFLCGHAAPKAKLRIWVEDYGRLRLTGLRFGRVSRLAKLFASTRPYRFIQELPNHVALFRLDGARPRFDWIRKVISVDDDTAAAAKLQFAASSIGLPENGVMVGPVEPAVSSPEGSIRVVENGTNRARLHVETPTGGWLQHNVSYDPGWRATIDGEATTIRPVNLVAQAVFVPPGSHEIVFSFWPVGLTVGLALTAVGLFLLVAAALVIRRERAACSAGPDRL